MTQHELKINSWLTERGGSLYLLVPPAIRDNYNLSKGLKCKIIPDTHNKVHVTFDQK